MDGEHQGSAPHAGLQGDCKVREGAVMRSVHSQAGPDCGGQWQQWRVGCFITNSGWAVHSCHENRVRTALCCPQVRHCAVHLPPGHPAAHAQVWAAGRQTHSGALRAGHWASCACCPANSCHAAAPCTTSLPLSARAAPCNPSHSQRQSLTKANSFAPAHSTCAAPCHPATLQPHPVVAHHSR